MLISPPNDQAVTCDTCLFKHPPQNTKQQYETCQEMFVANADRCQVM